MKGELIRWKNGIIMCFVTVGDYLGVRKVRGDTLMAFCPICLTYFLCQMNPYRMDILSGGPLTADFCVS